MKNKKLFAFTLSCVLAAGALGAFAGCNPQEGGTQGGGSGSGSSATGGFSFSEELLSTMEDSSADYNGNLFYVNSLGFQLADPSVIYITEGKDKGYFYAYGTSDEIAVHGFQAWRSLDLAHWECTGVAFLPRYDTGWAADNYWAPEVIYDAEDKLYYMFYNADNLDGGKYMSVAFSETPDGPFFSPTNKDHNGKQLSISKPVFDLTNRNPDVVARGQEVEANSELRGFVKTHAIDASPFIDPSTGERYLFFSYYNEYSNEGSFIYGMKMIDWYTPDYSTLTCLTVPGHSSIAHSLDSSATPDCTEANVNEGPFMMYHDGKYYLTFSIYGYTDEQYRVMQAVSDSPLGVYQKLSAAQGGTVISTDVVNWDHIVSAGHHAFITVGDELFIAYHTFLDRMTIAGGRGLAIDKVIWTKNSEGTPVMHTNGPTWSVQPLPAALSGYKNIAPSAKISASNTASGSDPALLNDGIVKYQEIDLGVEYEANKGTSEITLSWDSWKTVRSLLIYNSYDYFYAFTKIDRVDIEYLKADGNAATVTIKDLTFDCDWNMDDDYELMRPGGAAIAEFDEMPVRKITITVSSRSLKNTTAADYGIEEALNLNEIVVLGKDSQCAGVSEFKKYEYVNREFGVPHIVSDSKTFGTVEIDGVASGLKTMYGYDLSHDDGTDGAYIQQNGVRDQYAYFKGIYDTKFYAEAEFSVCYEYPDPMTGESILDKSPSPLARDQYPKFGIAISCYEQFAKNTVFYYIDANPSYTQSRVGAAQRTLDNTDWSWGANERLATVSGIKYTGGEYTKLAVLRLGGTFYFFCNGSLAITVDDFNVFTDTQSAAVGFLTFNTPMRVRNYMATADSDAVEAKKAELGL